MKCNNRANSEELDNFLPDELIEPCITDADFINEMLEAEKDALSIGFEETLILDLDKLDGLDEIITKE